MKKGDSLKIGIWTYKKRTWLIVLILLGALMLPSQYFLTILLLVGLGAFIYTPFKLYSDWQKLKKEHEANNAELNEGATAIKKTNHAKAQKAKIVKSKKA